PRRAISRARSRTPPGPPPPRGRSLRPCRSRSRGRVPTPPCRWSRYPCAARYMITLPDGAGSCRQETTGAREASRCRSGGECFAGPCGYAAEPPLRLAEIHRRAHLDAAVARARDAGGDRRRLVEILGVDEVEPAELLARLGEGAVGRDLLAVLDADGRRRRHG